MEKYKQEKEERTPAKNFNKVKREYSDYHPITPQTPITPSSDSDFITPPVKRAKSRRGLGPLMEQEQKIYKVVRDFRSPHQQFVHTLSPFNSENSFSVIQSPEISRCNYADENFYGDFYSQVKPLPSSPSQSRVLRNTQNLQTPQKVVYKSYEFDGIKPLVEEDDTPYHLVPNSAMTKITKIVPNDKLNITPLYMHPPEQLLAEDASPVKIQETITNTSLSSSHSNQVPSLNSSQASPTSDGISDVVLAVPRIQTNLFLSENSAAKASLCIQSKNQSDKDKKDNSTWRMRQPKKRWLQEAKMDEKLVKLENCSSSDSAKNETSETKDKLMGAIALVQLGYTDCRDLIQPLNLTNKKN